MVKYFFISQSFLKLFIIFCIFCIIVSCRRNSNPSNSLSNTKEGYNYEFYDYKSSDISQFLISAAEIKMEEIQMRQLAQQRGGSEFISELCKEMEPQQTYILNELNQLADHRDIYLSTNFSYYAKDTYQDFYNKEQNDFDKAYCDWIISNHQELIALFDVAINDTTDMEINEWVKSILPLLRIQLDHAIACQLKVGKV